MFLVSVVLAITYVRSERCVPFASAVALGLSLATKQYYVLAGPLLAATIVAVRVRQGRHRAAFASAACFALAPLAVFVATFLPWFAREYPVGEFVEFQLDAAREILSRDATFWANSEVLTAGGRQETWFLSWRASGSLWR